MGQFLASPTFLLSCWSLCAGAVMTRDVMHGVGSSPLHRSDTYAGCRPCSSPAAAAAAGDDERSEHSIHTGEACD